IDLAAGDHVLGVIRSAAGTPVLQVRDGRYVFDRAARTLHMVSADLVIAPEWAAASGRADLSQQWVGTLELTLDLQADGQEAEAVIEPHAPNVIGVDLMIGEMYSLTEMGRLGSYPDGTSGCAFATTSCNNGSVDIDWHGPMAEDHPFVGMAMFRRVGG